MLRFNASNYLANRRVRSFGAFGDLQRVPDIDDDVNSGSQEDDSLDGDGSAVFNKSSFDMVTLASWEEKAELGLFRYDVTACPTRVRPFPPRWLCHQCRGRAFVCSWDEEGVVSLCCMLLSHRCCEALMGSSRSATWAGPPRSGRLSFASTK